jgi:hypothetical protein
VEKVGRGSWSVSGAIKHGGAWKSKLSFGGAAGCGGDWLGMLRESIEHKRIQEAPESRLRREDAGNWIRDLITKN